MINFFLEKQVLFSNERLYDHTPCFSYHVKIKDRSTMGRSFLMEFFCMASFFVYVRFQNRCLAMAVTNSSPKLVVFVASTTPSKLLFGEA